MNLQENIRRILREETKLPLFIIRRFSEEDIDELISNVKFSIPLYGDDKNINDVIDDEVREFMMDKSDFGHHGTLRNDLTGNEYFVQLSKFEEPLRDYVRSVILNTNLQESIRRILREELKYKTLFRRLDRPDELGITFIDHMKRLSPCKYKSEYTIDPDEELFYDAAQSTTSIIIAYLSAFKFITTKDRIEESDVVVKLRRDIYDFLYENYLDVAKEYYKNNVTKCR